jgi:hypothetical protein
MSFARHVALDSPTGRRPLTFSNILEVEWKCGAPSLGETEMEFRPLSFADTLKRLSTIIRGHDTALRDTGPQPADDKVTLTLGHDGKAHAGNYGPCSSG